MGPTVEPVRAGHVWRCSMPTRAGLSVVVTCAFVLGVLCLPLAGQTPGSSSGVPQLIPMYGVMPDDLSKPHDKHLPLTFSIYAQPDDVAPLWSETHDVVQIGRASCRERV